MTQSADLKEIEYKLHPAQGNERNGIRKWREAWKAASAGFLTTQFSVDDESFIITSGRTTAGPRVKMPEDTDILPFGVRTISNGEVRPTFPYYYGKDYYFDDESKRLLEGGFFLRARIGANGYPKLTLKQIEADDNGTDEPTSRIEVEFSFDILKNPEYLLKNFSGKDCDEQVERIVKAVLSSEDFWQHSGDEDLSRMRDILKGLDFNANKLTNSRFISQHRTQFDLALNDINGKPFVDSAGNNLIFAEISLDLVRNIQHIGDKVIHSRPYWLAEIEINNDSLASLSSSEDKGYVLEKIANLVEKLKQEYGLYNNKSSKYSRLIADFPTGISLER